MTTSIATPDGVTSIAAAHGTDAGPRASSGAALRASPATAVIVATVALVVAIVAIPNWPAGVFQDDGIYVILGKALATGEGYRYLNLPGAPYATHYPPGYPLVLAALWKLAPDFPQNVAVFTFANAGLLALAAFAAVVFARGRLGLSTLGASAIAI